MKKTLFNSSLLFRLSSVIVCLVLAMGGFSIVLLNNMSEALHEEFQDKVVAIAKNLADNCVDHVLYDNEARLHSLLKNSHNSEKDIVYSIVYDSNHKIVAKNFSRIIPPEFYRSNIVYKNKTHSLKINKFESDDIVDIAVPMLLGEVGAVHVGFTTERIRSQIAKMRLMVISTISIISLLGIIIAVSLGALITRPIIKLSNIAMKIGKGDLNHKINISSGGEVGLLAEAFNEMISNLRKNIALRDAINTALRESERSYRALAENQPGAVFRKYLNNQNRIKFFNRISAEIIGFSYKNRDEVMFDSFEDKIDPEDLINYNKCLDNSLATMTPYTVDYKFKRTDGKLKYFREYGTPVFNDNNQPVYIDGLITDITKKKRTEEALKESTSLYRLLIDNIDLGVTYIDKNHNIIMSSPGHGKFYDKDATTFVGEKCYRVFQQRDDVCLDCPGRKALETGKIQEDITECRRHDGTNFKARVRAFPVMGKDQQVKGYVNLVEDISERLQMEENLKRGQQLEALGVLAGGIAHDFNNLLTAVYGNIELAKMYMEPTHESYKLLVEAGSASERSKKLTTKLLTFARGGDPVRKLWPMDELVKNSAELALADTNIEQEINIEEGLYDIKLDRIQIEQVLSDLLLNANEAMPKGGKIIINVENAILEEGDSTPLAPGKYIKLSIKDTGCGISPEILPMIFDPYFSSKNLCVQKGQGLGLAICHSIITRHKGFIFAESKEGEGATFNVFLPAVQEPVKTQPEDKGTKSELVAHAPKRVLLMDDEEAILQVTGEMLHSLGVPFEVARNGDEALELYKQELKAGVRFSLVILDLMVYEGMGGEETNRRLLELDPNAKTVIASGYVSDPIVVNCLDYGFMASLEKPYNVNALKDIVASV